jgi:hypothetical protein
MYTHACTHAGGWLILQPDCIPLLCLTLSLLLLLLLCMLMSDQVVQEAICPERRRGLDDQLSAVASITEVYVSGDLQVGRLGRA